MRFPLNRRVLIRGYKAHIAAGLGGAADYVANVGTPLYAPADGFVERRYYGSDGGNWLWFKTYVDNVSHQFAHLSAYRVSTGMVIKEGQLIALTGNTGEITTGPHLHLQLVKNGRRLDPEKYFSGAVLPGIPPIPPIGDDVTKKQWVDMAVLSAVPFWKMYHPGMEPDINSIINDLNWVYDGGDAGQLYKNWQAGQ